MPQQFGSSTAHFIKIYTLGNSRVVYRKKRDVAEIVISNKVRPITEQEIEFVKNNLLGDEANQAVTTKQGKLVEISINI